MFKKQQNSCLRITFMCKNQFINWLLLLFLITPLISYLLLHRVENVMCTLPAAVDILYCNKHSESER